MPRHNRPIPHTPYSPQGLSHQSLKKAFDTKQQAEQAAKEAMRYNIDLELYTYQSPADGKWYLSSKQPKA